FQTSANAYQMVLAINGYVGIGTSTPGNPLNVYTPGGGSPVGGMSIDVGTFGTSSNASNSYFLRVRDIGGNATPFQIQGNGNVVIGYGNLSVAGDVLLTGADCAEHFDVVGEPPEPGAVLVIDEEGALRECDDPYDKRVAGVVSGAGDFRHALVLDKKPSD